MNVGQSVSASMLVRIAAKLETTVGVLVGEDSASASPRWPFEPPSRRDDIAALYGRITNTDSRRAW